MSASDKFDTVKTEEAKSAIHDANEDSSKKKNGEYWLRVYLKDEENAPKLPYDQCIDEMPLLKGNSDFARKNNRFLKALYKQCKENLAPGEESKVMPFYVKVYRKNLNTEEDVSLGEDSEEMKFF